MQFSSQIEGEIRVLALAGRLDNLAASELDREIAAVLAGPGRHLVLDVENLDYVGSTGLRSVLGAVKRLTGMKERLAVAGPNPSVAEVLEISGFKSLVEVRESRAAAVAAVAG
jgi:anti-anti-sigma factor